MTEPKIKLIEELPGPSGEATLDQMWDALLNAQQFAAARRGRRPPAPPAPAKPERP